MLVLITSAAVAVTLAAIRHHRRGRAAAFALTTAIFAYTTVANVIERPDGVKIAACFIAAIILVSALSRVGRAFELRTVHVELDPVAEQFVRECARRSIRLIAHEPVAGDAADYRHSLVQSGRGQRHPGRQRRPPRRGHVSPTPRTSKAICWSTAASCTSTIACSPSRAPSIPNALAALLLEIRDRTGHRPHIYFAWTEGNPTLNFLRYLLFGQGQLAPVTREILRRQEPDPARRPHVHAG